MIDATVVAAGTSALAALGSLGTAFLTYRRNTNKDIRSCAEKIAVWSEGRCDDINESITLRNGYTLPVYDVFVIGCVNNENIKNIKTWNKYCMYIRVLGPGEIQRTMRSISGGMCKHMVLNIFFRDATGREWFRDSSGVLVEMKNYKELLSKKKIYAPYG